MELSEVDREQREREIFHGLRVLPGAWTVVRVDGRSFSRFTAERFAKPFDEAFSAYMVGTAEALLVELQGCYAYTESDEISVLLPRETGLFGRSLEKLVSISAGIASAVFTSSSGHVVHFDSRLWVGAGSDDVLDYFSWRQADAARCGLNGWAYWALRQGGASAREATRRLEGLDVAAKNELLFRSGINYNEIPVLQRRGVGLRWETYERAGTDPRDGRVTIAQRRRVVVERDLPMKDAYRAWLAAVVLPGPSAVVHGRSD